MCSGCWGILARPERPSPLAGDGRRSAVTDHAGDDAEDLQLLMAQIDPVHVRVGRLQPDAVGLDEEALERHPLAVDHRDDDLAIAGVVALIGGEEVTLKRIRQEPGRVLLYPENSAMRAMEYHPEEVQIQGVLVGQMRAYR